MKKASQPASQPDPKTCSDEPRQQTPAQQPAPTHKLHQGSTSRRRQTNTTAAVAVIYEIVFPFPGGAHDDDDDDDDYDYHYAVAILPKTRHPFCFSLSHRPASAMPATQLINRNVRFPSFPLCIVLFVGYLSFSSLFGHLLSLIDLFVFANRQETRKPTPCLSCLSSFFFIQLDLIQFFSINKSARQATEIKSTQSIDSIPIQTKCPGKNKKKRRRSRLCQQIRAATNGLPQESHISFCSFSLKMCLLLFFLFSL